MQKNPKTNPQGDEMSDPDFHLPPAQSVAHIRERMEVVGSCGNKVGVVDHIRADAIQLTRGDAADGRHHFVPLDWVAGVDDKVHLDRSCEQAVTGWATEAATR